MKLSEKLKELQPILQALRLKASIHKEFTQAREIKRDMDNKVFNLISIVAL